MSGPDRSLTIGVIAAMVLDQQFRNSVVFLAKPQSFNAKRFGVDQRYLPFPMRIVLAIVPAPNIMEQGKIDQDLLVRLTQGII